MNTLKFYIICSAVFAVSLIESCTPVNLSTLITDKTWTIDYVTKDGVKLAADQILASEGVISKMTFNEDGSIVYTDSLGLNAVTGKWQFQLNNTQLVVSGIKVGKSDQNTIVELSNTNFTFWHMNGANKITLYYKYKL